MSKNWAITVGINQYRFLSDLNYAVQDADAVCQLFQDLAFERIYSFTDHSQPIALDYGNALDSAPTYTTLSRFLDIRFKEPFLGDGDNLWFFFAGHGIRENGHDYLIPSDGYRDNLEGSSIPIRYISDRLRLSGADNIILLIDACRSSEGSRGSMGVGLEEQQGVITLFACSPSEYSYEIKELQQGAFTHVLLQSLRLKGEQNCATVERLYEQLRRCVPRLTQQHRLATQTPYGIVEPISKKHLILLPKMATQADMVTLKNLALRAEVNHDIAAAKQLWIRVLAASTHGADPDAVEGLCRISAGSTISEADYAVEKKVIDLEEQLDDATFASRSSETDADSTEKLAVVDFFPPKPLSVDLLVSNRGTDYTRLKNLLEQQQWQAANQETESVMLQISRRQREKWLNSKAINRFPQADLQTIDRLWCHYSCDRFGFTIQQQIFVETYGKEPEFVARVAWQKAALYGGMLDFSSSKSLQFTISAPVGHLPFVFCGEHIWIFDRLKSA
ncbi:MAG: GUN4 domain-containing protein [Phormidesmis sp.]